LILCLAAKLNTRNGSRQPEHHCAREGEIGDIQRQSLPCESSDQSQIRGIPEHSTKKPHYESCQQIVTGRKRDDDCAMHK
jgi:hypothetical protein